jgi:hypothetical protein
VPKLLITCQMPSSPTMDKLAMVLSAYAHSSRGARQKSIYFGDNYATIIPDGGIERCERGRFQSATTSWAARKCCKA